MRSSTLAVHDRQWLARELHDSVVQDLNAMLVEMELFKREQSHTVVLEHLDHFQATTRGALSNMRQTLYQLRDEPLRGDQFMQWLEHGPAEVMARSGVAVRIRVRRCPRALSADASYNLSRIIEEALRNVVRHSRARHVVITVGVVDQHLVLGVHDDGDGCISMSGAVKPGLGIIGMVERALVIGGTLTVRGWASGGTSVRARFPVERLR